MLLRFTLVKLSPCNLQYFNCTVGAHDSCTIQWLVYVCLWVVYLVWRITKTSSTKCIFLSHILGLGTSLAIRQCVEYTNLAPYSLGTFWFKGFNICKHFLFSSLFFPLFQDFESCFQGPLDRMGYNKISQSKQDIKRTKIMLTTRYEFPCLFHNFFGIFIFHNCSGLNFVGITWPSMISMTPTRKDRNKDSRPTRGQNLAFPQIPLLVVCL